MRRLDTEHALHKAWSGVSSGSSTSRSCGLADSQVVGAEALLRWQHPQRGLMLPGDFLSVSEDSDLAVTIGDWVLQEAFIFLAGADARPR